MNKPSRSFLQSLSPAQFARISQLLDQCLDMSAEDRLMWLVDLERSDPESAGILRTLLDLQGNSSNHSLLEGNLVADLVGPLPDSKRGVGAHPHQTSAIASCLCCAKAL